MQKEAMNLKNSREWLYEKVWKAEREGINAITVV